MDGAERPRAKHLPILVENPRELAGTYLEPPPQGPGELAAVPRVSREILRSRRKRPVRAVTLNMQRFTKRELEAGRLLNPPVEGIARPASRSECKGAARPCPFVSCAHHLYLDVSAKTGAIKLNFPDLEVEQMGVSCALDVADRAGETLEAVGDILNMTRERVRQIETVAIRKLRATGHLREHVEGDRVRQSEPHLEDDDERPELAPGPVADVLDEFEFDVATFLALDDLGPEAA